MIALVGCSSLHVAAENGQHVSNVTNSSEPCYGTMVGPAPNATNVPLNTTIVFSWTTTSSPSYVNLQLTPQVPIANITTLVLTVPTSNGNTTGSVLCNQSFRYEFRLGELLKSDTTYTATLFYGAEAQNAQTASWTFTTVPSSQTPLPLSIIVTIFVVVIIVVTVSVALLVLRRKRLGSIQASDQGL